MCFKQRKTPARCIAVLSLFAAAAGAAMIVFGYFMTTNKLLEQVEKNSENVKAYKDNAFLVLLVFSAVVVGISTMGLCFLRTEARWFAGVYGCVLLPTWLILGLIGFSGILVAQGAKDEIDEECSSFTNTTPAIYY